MATRNGRSAAVEPARRGAARKAQAAVVVGIDFHPGSQLALARAEALARESDARLFAVHVVTGKVVLPGMPLPVGWKTTAQGDLEFSDRALPSAVRLARSHLGEWTQGLDAERLVRTGRPHDVLSSIARARKAWLAVVGVHEARRPVESFLLGSTAERLLRKATTPVLLARTKGVKPYRRLLVAVDLTDMALDVLELVARRFPAAELHVLHFLPIWDRTREFLEWWEQVPLATLRELCAKAGLEGDRLRIDVMPGRPRQGILSQARARKADLIVLGTHARRAASRALLGSVAEHVTRAAPIDVLAIPPQRRPARVPAAKALRTAPVLAKPV